MKTEQVQMPPKWPLKFLRLILKKEYLEEIEGDMLEVFQDDLESAPSKARIRYTLQVLKLIRPKLVKGLSTIQKPHYYDMFKTYFTTALRNLIKRKTHTAINISGLAIAMAISMLIILFLIDQDRMDEHNPRAGSIYRLTTEFFDESRNRNISHGTTPYELAEVIKFNVEDVEDASQIVKGNGNIKFKDKVFGYRGLYVSPNFLGFFEYDLLSGNRGMALQSGNVVLSVELAEKLFSQVDPVGQLVELIDIGSFVVSGVVDSEAVKSHLRFDLLLPGEVFAAGNKHLLSDWGAGWKRFYNYFKLKEKASPDPLLVYANDLDSKFPAEEKALYSFGIQRLDKINLGRVVRNEVGLTTPGMVLYFFIVLALVLMLSASFNYMNLSIARGLRRAKEVGIRKITGAGKMQIIMQFLVEAQLVMFCALIFAFLLLQVLVPTFNNLKILRDIDGAITLDFNSNVIVYLVFIAFAVVVGLVSGIYPALYLASFKSLSVLKGPNHKGKSSFIFRKILVFIQYTFSIIFIITTIILYQQAQIIVKTNYGFNHANVMNVNIKDLPYPEMRNELMKRSEIKGVSAVSDLPVLSSLEEVDLVNKEMGPETIKSFLVSMDPFAIDNLELQLVSGRNFRPGLKSDKEQAVIVNEKAITMLGYADAGSALHQTIELIRELPTGQETIKKKIVGVVRDFRHQFVMIESGPLVMDYDPDRLSIMNIRFEGSDTEMVAAVVENIWREFDSSHPFQYDLYSYDISDIDDEFIDIVHIVGLISAIAIIIACLGQFSMVLHHVQLKVKEIGIRKVLGSNLSGLMLLLSKEFLVIILLAILVAIPVAWRINAFWTGKIFESPEVSVINISVGVAIVFLLAMLTIFSTVRRAVHANPVESLKYE